MYIYTYIDILILKWGRMLKGTHKEAKNQGADSI